MLETFVIERFSKQNLNDDIYNLNVSPVVMLIGLVISLLAAYLAFNCNVKENAATQWVITIFAFLCPFIYVVYYFIVHVLLGYPCYPKKK